MWQEGELHAGLAKAPARPLDQTPMTWAILSKPWQPLTPKGAAAFAVASFTRLYVVLLCFALGTGFAVAFFLSQMCVPAIDRTLRQMPETAVLSLGEIFALDQAVSANTPFLSIDVDVSAEVPNPHASDVRLLIHRTGWKACSVLGCFEQSFAPDATYALGPSHLGPKWAAWKPLVFLVAILGTVVWLIVCWTVLATLYWLPLWVSALIARRQLGCIGAWKTAAAGLMPGCALMTAAIVLYTVRWIDLPTLAFFNAAHLVVGWIFLGVVVALLPRKEAKANAAAGPNPFGDAPRANPFEAPPADKPASAKKKSNPFSAE